jgi:hypothetical protein
MDSDGNSKPIRSWLLTIILLMAIVGLFIVVAIPNFVGGGPSRLNSIVNNLIHLDGAKNQWAWEHGITNVTQVSRQLTDVDIARYLISRDNRDHFDRFGSGFDHNGHIHSVIGEKYNLNVWNVSPEAKLSRNYFCLPKGTVIRLGSNDVEYVLPGQESTPYRENEIWNVVSTNHF